MLRTNTIIGSFLNCGIIDVVLFILCVLKIACNADCEIRPKTTLLFLILQAAVHDTPQKGRGNDKHTTHPLNS